jgi:hypothetical protein
MRNTLTFKNENGNTITIQVIDDENGLTVKAYGHGTVVEHTWTPLEAEVLRHMLDIVPRKPVLNTRVVISGGITE